MLQGSLARYAHPALCCGGYLRHLACRSGFQQDMAEERRRDHLAGAERRFTCQISGQLQNYDLKSLASVFVYIPTGFDRPHGSPVFVRQMGAI